MLHFVRQWSLIFLSHQGLHQWNGHLFPYIYIEALYEAMVIDFFTSRPCTRQWALISLSYQGLLQWNGRWFSYVYIEALYKGTVIDFLVISRLSPWKWSNSLCCIKTLSVGMVIDSFIYRPPLWDWPNRFFQIETLYSVIIYSLLILTQISIKIIKCEHTGTTTPVFSLVGMVTGRGGDGFRYPIPIPVEKNYPHPHLQIQRVSKFCPIPIPTG